MKVKTKVKAGPRDCGGGKLPPGADIPQSGPVGAPRCSTTIMKVNTKVRTGRGCGMTSDLQQDRQKSWPCAGSSLDRELRQIGGLIPQRGHDVEVRCACCAPS